jgi:hypothetical protein
MFLRKSYLQASPIYRTESPPSSNRQKQRNQKSCALSRLLNIQEESFVVLQHFMYAGFDSTLSVFIVKTDTLFVKHVCVFVHQTYKNNVPNSAYL